MKKYISQFLILGTACLTASVSLSSCDDFFDPETSDALSGDQYMSSLTEMTTGYLGILTKMQAVGDKEIYLTDTRGEMLEPTNQSIAELIALYNYEDDLSGNSYANPAGYYDLVIACNDYIDKMTQFHASHPELVAETDYFEGLFASAIRVKVWTYLTMGEIYGQALWFDDPITEIKDVTDASLFRKVKMDEIVTRCLALLENSYSCNSLQIDPATDFSWIAWVDPEHATNIAESKYRFWDQMTPSYKALMVKLKIWDAAYQDAKGDAVASKADYEYVAETVLQMLHNQFVGNVVYWKRGARTKGVYSNMWNYANPNQEESVSAIIYDYTKNQTNQLLHHFSNEYPNAYLLTTNAAARARFADSEFAPLGTAAEDPRLGTTTKQNGSIWYVSKYRPIGSSVRTNAYQDDVHIYTTRAAELYLWLMEALNHLNRFTALDALMNNGFNSTQSEMFTNIELGETETLSDEDLFQYQGFSSYWINSKTGGTYAGFRNCMGVGSVKFWKLGQLDENSNPIADADVYRHNDEILCNEWLLECACEGKTYPNMNRFAERYQDPTIVSDRVKLKYEAAGKDAEVAAKISAINPNSQLPGYWVPWKL